jgi:hypothetical protein
MSFAYVVYGRVYASAGYVLRERRMFFYRLVSSCPNSDDKLHIEKRVSSYSLGRGASSVPPRLNW